MNALVKWFAVAAVASAASCAVSDSGATDPTSGPTEVMFWTSSPAGQIAVTVDDAPAGTITEYFTTAPKCGAVGSVTVTLSPGTHSMRARSAAGTTWQGNFTMLAGVCTVYALDAAGGTTGGQPPSSTGARISMCVSNIPPPSSAQWLPMPAPLSGLDAKVFWSESFSTASVLFRNRYTQKLNFGFDMYRQGAAPPPTEYRDGLASGAAESGPYGAILGVNVGLGGTACVIVDKVRFGEDDFGPYYNP
jgi:hypothetical protein